MTGLRRRRRRMQEAEGHTTIIKATGGRKGKREKGRG